MKGLIKGTSNYRMREEMMAERLRDAAPELLSALKGLIELIEENEKYEKVSSIKSGFCREAIEAIAKAESK